jgi:hypothetical protein
MSQHVVHLAGDARSLRDNRRFSLDVVFVGQLNEQRLGTTALGRLGFHQRSEEIEERGTDVSDQDECCWRIESHHLIDVEGNRRGGSYG